MLVSVIGIDRYRIVNPPLKLNTEASLKFWIFEKSVLKIVKYLTRQSKYLKNNNNAWSYLTVEGRFSLLIFLEIHCKYSFHYFEILTNEDACYSNRYCQIEDKRKQTKINLKLWIFAESVLKDLSNIKEDKTFPKETLILEAICEFNKNPMHFYCNKFH